MMEYLKRKFAKLNTKSAPDISYPLYYEENGRIVKELSNGEKWIVRLDDDYREVLLERVR